MRLGGGSVHCEGSVCWRSLFVGERAGGAAGGTVAVNGERGARGCGRPQRRPHCGDAARAIHRSGRG
ncbi:hypothetical protein LG3211_3956 [Lysobacter gummosus]|nr:hypothetical protein LG3211_3956 [Lysobacter gummosus]